MSSATLIYMDACCFIDLAKTDLKMPTLQSREPHIFFCRSLLDAARGRDATVYTSTISVVECVKLTDSTAIGGPTREDDEVKDIFRRMLMSGRSGVMPVMPNPRITELARDLRWNHGITCKPMDRIHLATALATRCSNFLTSDEKLGEENVTKLGQLGLTIGTADSISHLLPHQYRQMPLQTPGSSAHASPPAVPN